MAAESQARGGFISVASVAVEAVTPKPSGFELRATGEDSSEYLMEMSLDMPIDRRTQTVLGELLSQSEWRVWRRARRSLRDPRPTRDRRRDSVSPPEDLKSL